jgi:single-strand DNA-binding protein
MNSLRNKVQLIGNLGNNPEVKVLNNNRKMVRLSLATTDSYRDADGKKITDTQWHNIVAWGNVANIIEKYMKKGDEIAVEGRLIHRSYEDKSGTTKYISEVVINDVVMLKSNSHTKE